MVSEGARVLANALKNDNFRKFYLNSKLDKPPSPQEIELLMETLDYAKFRNNAAIIEYLEEFVRQLKYSPAFLKYMLGRRRGF